MKKNIIIFVLLTIFIFLSLVLYNNNKGMTSLQQMKEDMQIYNYNIEVKQENHELNYEIALGLNEDILKYLKSGEIVSVLNSYDMSTVEYFKEIIITNSLNEEHLKNKTVEEILELDLFKNYVFYDVDSDSFIVFFSFSSSANIVILEIYCNNGIVTSVTIH